METAPKYRTATHLSPIGVVHEHTGFASLGDMLVGIWMISSPIRYTSTCTTNAEGVSGTKTVFTVVYPPEMGYWGIGRYEHGSDHPVAVKDILHGLKFHGYATEEGEWNVADVVRGVQDLQACGFVDE